ncbi:sensor histidine kinase [Desulfoplanes formicivorans]|uniref:histidine kinase n=1 Tax=Desulfoplanes formicivorans TaxID=1592317 RepID=A0A194AGZ3_9BACT|nr:ATP-binding protein [Desulfoplanes formicivorans]GAU08598.1 histidine kinase [Desulfoplanes formicivorans]
MPNPLRPDPAHPFQIVKFLSWGSLILILGFSLFLSVFLANYARNMVLQKKKDFALLLAENLNHQIYQRFTLPTVLGFGRVQLKQKAQYKRLDQVVISTIHSFHVLDVRIYDTSSRIAYSMKEGALEKQEIGGRQVQEAIEKQRFNFELLSRLSNWHALFTLDPPARSFVLRTTYPLRAERKLGRLSEAGPLMGVLVFTQDITEDYEQVIHFQRLIIVTTFLSFLVLFFLLWVLIIRADRIFAERMREKKKLEDELHQNEKLASMGRMVASIAHEIRNPLGIIRSSAELLLKRARKEKDSRAGIIQAVLDEAERLGRIVNDFLDYARPKTPNRAVLDLCRIVDHVLAFLENDLEARQIAIVRDCPAKTLIQGDNDLLYRAVYNLVINATQAMDGPGTIRITAFELGREVILEICDTGSGFDADMLEKYLEPFYTTKDFGTGLGLSIVSTILQSHGARLELDNAPEGGGVVRIVFVRPDALA